MLTPYSSQALAVLLQYFPDWSTLVTQQEGTFQVAFTTPAGWNFWLGSDEEEQLTVGLAEFHTHFGGYSESSAEADAKEAALFVQALQRQELVLAVWYDGEQYLESAVLPANEEPQVLRFGHNQRVQVKQWA